MSLIFTESFDCLGTTRSEYGNNSTVVPPEKWDETNVNATIGAGRNGGGAGPGIGSPLFFTKIFPAADRDDLIVVGMAFRIAVTGTSTHILKLYGDNTTTTHLTLRTKSDGNLEVRLGDESGAVIGTSTGVSLSSSAWTYIEMKARLHNSTGSVVVRVNEVAVITLTNIDTRNGGTVELFSAFSIHHSSQSAVTHDDIYVCNEQGSTNTDFLGDVRIEARFPTGNGNYSQWVGSDADSTDNYLLVDDTSNGTSGPNDDTDYVKTSTDNNKDSYVFSDLASATDRTVYGVILGITARREGVTARNIAGLARLSGIDAQGADQALVNTNTNYGHYQARFETKPGGGAWTVTDVNDAEFGVVATP